MVTMLQSADGAPDLLRDEEGGHQRWSRYSFNRPFSIVTVFTDSSELSPWHIANMSTGPIDVYQSTPTRGGRLARAPCSVLSPHIHTFRPSAHPAAKSTTPTSSSLPTLSEPVSHAQPEPEGDSEPTTTREEEEKDEGHDGEQSQTRHPRDNGSTLCDGSVFGGFDLFRRFGDVVVTPVWFIRQRDLT